MTRSEFGTTADYLFSLKPQGTKFGVDRMATWAQALGHPERLVPAIHVAGTNGKGSVAAMLEAILRSAGWKVGLFTSPHLVHVGERVQVNRRPLTEAELAGYVRELQPVADRVAAQSPEDRPSFFEWMTAIAFLHFARERCDVAIYEVGLGGRLDATNVLSPMVSVITSIGLDHCEYLGDKITQIAAEKAGIIKSKVPVVIGRMPREAEAVIRAKAAECDARLTSVPEVFGDAITRYPGTNLGGEYQRWNAATATLTARTLASRWKVTDEVITRGLQQVEWAGRWDRRRLGGRTVILDASHNPEGAAVLERNLADLFAETGVRPVVVTGILGAARARPLIETICRFAAEVHLVAPNQPRATPYEELVALIPATFEGRVFPGRVEAIFPGGDQCTVGREGDVVVVTGSIYLLGEVLGQMGPISSSEGKGRAPL